MGEWVSGENTIGVNTGFFNYGIVKMQHGGSKLIGCNITERNDVEVRCGVEH
jgi:proline racemase